MANRLFVLLVVALEREFGLWGEVTELLRREILGELEMKGFLYCK